MRVVIYRDNGKRSRAICSAWQLGLGNRGIDFHIQHADEWRGQVEADVAVFYGLKNNLREIQRAYSENPEAHAVFVDLGYWGRTEGGRLEGYHRISVDGLHASDYFQNITHDTDRIKRFGVKVAPMKKNEDGHILLCGQSGKAAWVFGLAAEEWERNAITALKKYTSREIIYRPKPSWNQAAQIEGTKYSPPEQQLNGVLSTAWAVVTHHSNVGIEALAEGIPSFTLEGLAKPLSRKNLNLIESPLHPTEDQRQQLLNDVAYTQWNVQEIRAGAAWDYLTKEVF